MDSLSGQREQSSHIVRHTRIIAPEPNPRDKNVALNVLDWFAPYGRNDYPGKYRLIQRYSPGYALDTLRAWLRGKRHAPTAMLQHWLEVLTGQEERIADLKRELIDEIARLENRPKRVPHFEAVRRKRLERPR